MVLRILKLAFAMLALPTALAAVSINERCFKWRIFFFV